MESNKVELSGIFTEGYGIIPKKLMRMKFDDKIGHQKGKNLKLVLAYMLSYTGAGNTCFPAIDTIASDLEMSRTTVIEAIHNACKLQLIEKHKLFPENSLKQQNKYELLFISPKVQPLDYGSPAAELRESSQLTLDVQPLDCINNISNNNTSKNKKNTPKLYLGGTYTWKECIKMYQDISKENGHGEILAWDQQGRSFGKFLAICDNDEMPPTFFRNILKFAFSSKWHKENRVKVTPNSIYKSIDIIAQKMKGEIV